MNDKSIIKNLFKHMQWADAEVWKVVEQSPNIENDKKIKLLLYHIHLVQFLFLKIWKNEKLDHPKEDEINNLIEIREWSKENYSELNNFLDEFDENQLEKIVQIPWAKGIEKKFSREPEQVTMKDTMLQVATHSNYHRAQANMKLRELGYDPPSVDYIVWLWLGKPKP